VEDTGVDGTMEARGAHRVLVVKSEGKRDQVEDTGVDGTMEACTQGFGGKI